LILLFPLIVVGNGCRNPASPHARAAGGASFEFRHLFPVEAVDTTTSTGRVTVLLSDRMLSRPSPGNYLLVDIEGRLGEARILLDRVRGLTQRLEPPFHVELEWETPPLRDAHSSGMIAAVGPLRATLPSARLMRTGMASGFVDGEIRAEAVVAPRGQPTYAVDLDGDARADAVGYFERREGGPVAPHELGWTAIAESWRRRAEQWERIEYCSWDGMDLIGP
jgi:hypothetical protein